MAIEDIIVIDDFITDEECSALVEYEKYLTENGLWDVGDKFGDPNGLWSDRFLGVVKLRDPSLGFGSELDLEMFDLLVSIRLRIRDQILKHYQLDKIYADSYNLIRWPMGVTQPAHSDYENFGGQPHIYNWRQIGCVLYLNDDFKGGEIHFPQHGAEIRIRPKMLAFFPGDVFHAHGVNRILEGTRYTVNCFWTEFEDHKDQLPQ